MCWKCSSFFYGVSRTVIGIAVEPKTKADLDKLGNGLAIEEDPTFQVKTDDDLVKLLFLVWANYILKF